MTPFVLHIARRSEDDPAMAWERALTNSGIEIQRVPGAAPAAALLRSHEPLAILICMKDGEVQTLRTLRDLRASCPKLPPVLGICAGLPDPAVQVELVGCGMELFIHVGSPPEILLAQLALHRRARGRNGAADTGPGSNGPAEVIDAELATRSRKLLHDLSQPLAAIQGRLEILGIKAPEDDPMKPVYARLVGMCVQAGEAVQSLREIHRRP